MEQETESNAAEVLAKLREGKELQHATVSKLTLSGEFAHPVRLDHCVVKRLRVEHATFAGGLSFRGCDLHKPHVGKEVTIEGDLDLRSTSLVRADFTGITATGELRLDMVRTKGALRVSHSSFEGVRCWGAHFGDWVEFSKCTFRSRADYRNFHGDEGFSAKDCRFEDEFWFRGSTVSKKFELLGSYFGGMTDFSKSKLRDVSYLEGMEQGPKQQFAFRNALFDRVLLRPSQIQGR
ncbi:MAG: pentapeptide repeat-containing protein, partial [Verrucomicrobiota bacterium]